MILDQFGRPVESRKLPERAPLATAPIYDSWRDYVAEGLKPATLSALLKSADAGDVARQCELFEQMEEKDGHILGEKTKRMNVILDVDFQLLPASDDARDIKVAEFVKAWIDNQADWPDVLVSLQDAVGKGYAGLEIAWDVSGGQAMPSGLEFIEQKRFLFYDQAGYLAKIPRLITDADPMGIEIPAWKMLLHRYGGKSGHATRSGIYRVCAWMYLFKNYTIKDWVIFCEVFGMPLRLGKYATGASKADKDALVAAIASLGTDAAGVISKDTEIEFVDKVQKTATADLYKLLADFANKENSKAILGQTLTAEVGDKGSYAASQTHNDVRKDLLKADGRALAGTIRSQLIRPMVGFNFGWDTPVPKYVAQFEEGEDLSQASNWITRLLDRGVEMPAVFVRQKFGIPEPKKGEAVVGNSVLPVPAKHHVVVAKQAAGEDVTPIDQVSDRMAEEAAPAWEAILARIRTLADEATDLPDLRDKLLAAFADLPGDQLAEVMVAGLTAADLAGRFDLERESA